MLYYNAAALLSNLHFNLIILQLFRRMQNENRNFQDIEQLVEALLEEPPAAPVNSSPPVEERETVGPIEVQQQPLEVCENPSQALKRNNDANELANNVAEPMEGETPLKRCKTGLLFWLVYLHILWNNVTPVTSSGSIFSTAAMHYATSCVMQQLHYAI